MSIPRPTRDEAEFIVKHYPSSDRAHLFASAYLVGLDENEALTKNYHEIRALSRKGLSEEQNIKYPTTADKITFLLTQNEALRRNKDNERERCAKIAEEHAAKTGVQHIDCGLRIAERIRMEAIDAVRKS